jgi:hypothetical protein
MNQHDNEASKPTLGAHTFYFSEISEGLRNFGEHGPESRSRFPMK